MAHEETRQPGDDESRNSEAIASDDVAKPMVKVPLGVLPYAGRDASEGILLEELWEGNVIVLPDRKAPAGGGSDDLLGALNHESALYADVLAAVRASLSSAGLSRCDFSSGVALVDKSDNDGSLSVALVLGRRGSGASMCSEYVTVVIRADSWFSFFSMPSGEAVYDWGVVRTDVSHDRDAGGAMETIRRALPYFARRNVMPDSRGQNQLGVADMISQRIGQLGTRAEHVHGAAASPSGAVRAACVIGDGISSQDDIFFVDANEVDRWYEAMMQASVVRTLHEALRSHGIRWQAVTSVGLAYQSPFVCDLVVKLFLFSIGHGEDGLRDAIMLRQTDGVVRDARWLGIGIDAERFAEIGVTELSAMPEDAPSSMVAEYERRLKAAMRSIF